MPNCCNPQGSNHHLPLSVEVLIGMLERNWKLVFILNAYLLEEKFKYNRSRILQVELDINKSEYIILHCIAERFYFLLFIRVRKMTKLLFIRAHMLQVEGWLPFSVLRFFSESEKLLLFLHCVVAVNIYCKHWIMLCSYCLK